MAPTIGRRTPARIARTATASCPSYDRTRNEGFGKLTFTPTSSVLVNVSYRDSHRLDTSDLFASNASATTGTGNEAWQRIASAEGSWVINSRSHLTVRYSDYVNETQGRPDNVAGRFGVHRHRHPARRRPARSDRPALGAGADRRTDRLQRLRPAADRSLWLRRERRQGRRRHGRLRDDLRRGQLLPRLRTDRLQRDLRRRAPPRSPRRLSALSSTPRI